MHADLEGFEGAEEEVGDEFCGGGGSEEDERLGGVGEEFLAVVVFECFVGSVFAGSLEGVADEGGGPACEDAAEAFLFEDCAPGLGVGFVEGGIDLTAAFYEVEGGYGCVGWSAGWMEMEVSFQQPMRCEGRDWLYIPMMPPNVQAAK